MSVWPFITSFGTAAALFPLSLLMAGWLIYIRAARTAALWLALMATGSLLVALTKGAFIGWGIGIRALDLTCISGHSMLSAAVYPAAVFLLVANSRPPLRRFMVAIGYGLAALIACSRYFVHAHSPAEAVVGFLLGSALSLWFISAAEIPRARRFPITAVAAAMVMLLASLHTERLPTEGLITRVALALSGHDRPYVRVEWLNGQGPDDSAAG